MIPCDSDWWLPPKNPEWSIPKLSHDFGDNLVDSPSKQTTPSNSNLHIFSWFPTTAHSLQVVRHSAFSDSELEKKNFVDLNAAVLPPKSYISQIASVLRYQQRLWKSQIIGAYKSYTFKYKNTNPRFKNTRIPLHVVMLTLSIWEMSMFTAL